MLKKLICIALAAVTILMLLAAEIHASSTIITLAMNRHGNLVRTQDAYLPNRSITTLGMNSPQSMVFGPRDLLYIADTGNRRILVFDINLNEVVHEIEHPEFVSPRGVFVTPDNILYVADAGAGAIFLFDAYTGEYIRTHVAPDAMAFANTDFAPNRIAVDLRGNMYIVGEGVFGGIIQMSAEGEFLGFFASNETTLTFMQLMQNTFLTQRQREGLADRIPGTFSNVTADSRGIIYTASLGTMVQMQFQGIKRHDMAGRNTIHSLIPFDNHIDVAVDANGNVFSAQTNGWISVFTNSGELIFTFGASSAFDGGAMPREDVAGWFRSLQAIAISSAGEIWALDSERNFLQSFVPTSYTLLVYEALHLFNAGMYNQSRDVLTDVLRHNQMSVLAHTGMGRAHLYNQDFELAMNSFYLGGNREYYGAAFWEVRNNWLQQNIGMFILFVIIFFAVLSVIRNFDKSRIVATAASGYKNRMMEAPFVRPVLFAFTVARHPLDSYYYLKRKEKGTFGGAFFHFILFFVAYMVYQISRGFLIQVTAIHDMDFTVIIGGFFAIYILFVVCNYLVASINDGEGSIGDIFKLVSYGLFPFTITLFAITALSHVVTANEVFLLNFVMLFGGVYSIIVLLLGFQEVHNYGFGQTIKSLLITAIFMVIALVVLFNLAILLNEIIIFLESIGTEVYINVTNMV